MFKANALSDNCSTATIILHVKGNVKDRILPVIHGTALRGGGFASDFLMSRFKVDETTILRELEAWATTKQLGEVGRNTYPSSNLPTLQVIVHRFQRKNGANRRQSLSSEERSRTLFWTDLVSG